MPAFHSALRVFGVFQIRSATIKPTIPVYFFFILRVRTFVSSIIVSAPAQRNHNKGQHNKENDWKGFRFQQNNFCNIILNKSNFWF
jgi:hypothetical protein